MMSLLARRAVLTATVGLMAAVPTAFAISHADPGEPPSGSHVKCSVHTTTTTCGRHDDAEIRSKPNLKDVPAAATKPATKTPPSVVQPKG